MGIKNFIKLHEKYSPESITDKTITDYTGKVLGIDANLMIYKMVYAIRQNGYDIKNGNVIVTHIHTLLLKLLGFIKYNITPVFVFDGLAPEIKEETLQKRKNIHKSSQKKYDESVTIEDKNKYYLRFGITEQELNDCKELIRLFNYSVVDCIEEADSQLVELLNCGKIDYIVTDDMDILVFGGGILKNFTVSTHKKIQEINLEKFKADTGLTQKMIIDISILLGCDYCVGAHGLGPIKSYELVKKYGSIENIMERAYIELNTDYTFIRGYFENPNVIKCEDLEKIHVFTKCDKNKMYNLLKKWDFDDKYIDKVSKVCC